MSIYTANGAARRRRSAVFFSALATVLSLAVPVLADDDCLNVGSTDAEPDFTPCSWEAEIDINSAIANHATTPRTPTSDRTPWIAQSGRDVPLSVNSSDTGVSVRTSLGTWRDYNARVATPNLDPKAAAGASLALPKAPAAPKSPLDLWSNVDVQGYDGSKTQSTRAGVGADYKLDKAATVGVSVEHGDARSSTDPRSQLDEKAAAYVTLQAAPMLSLDARTEWQAGNAEFAAANGAAEKGAFILAPKINHTFTLDNGKTLEPFVTYKREFDLSVPSRDAADAATTPTRTLGAGVTYKNADDYSLSVTADVDSTGPAQPDSLNSKFQLSVPIR